MKGNAIQYIAQPGRALNPDRYGGRKVINNIRLSKEIYIMSDKYHVTELNMWHRTFNEIKKN
jgi:hypothetical protein